MSAKSNLIDRYPIAELLERYPFAEEFFLQNRIDPKGFESLTFSEYLSQLDPDEIEEKALDCDELPAQFDTYLRQMAEFLGIQTENQVRSLTILPGTDKSNTTEGFDELTILPGQIISIVGPTGSGKSRLLADIEWAAQKDTPTGRSIRINGERPDPKWRYSANNKLVAQLSQNMNFVMDLKAGEFLELHAQSRMIKNSKEIAEQILEAANQLAGESFTADTPVTALSGGQSRALMIADTAILSASPIVLIDEIENAGIDRKKALDVLVSQDKIVLMATHDPLLALMADRRIVIRNGGIHSVLSTTPEEKELLRRLEELDAMMGNARRQLRQGCSLKLDLMLKENTRD